MGFVARLFCTAAGADISILNDPSCAQSRGYRAAMGVQVVATSVLAGASATLISDFYLYNGNLSFALATGIGWGSFIFILDRGLLVSLDGQPDLPRHQALLMSAPRMGLAALIALAIAIPTEILAFRARTDQQVLVDAQEDVAQAEARIAKRYGDIPDLQKQRDKLADDTLAAEKRADAAAHEAVIEADGTGGSRKRGAQGIYEIKHREALRLVASAEAALKSANTEIVQIDKRLDGLRGARDTELASYQNTVAKSGDILGRWIALERMKSDPRYGRIVTLGGWVIEGISFLAELGPLLMALFRTPGAYEAAVVAKRDIGVARWKARRQVALHRAAAYAQIELRKEAAAVTTLEKIVDAAGERAMTSPAVRRAQRAIVREIVERAVPAAQRATRNAFNDDLEADIAAAAQAARAKAAGRAANAAARQARAFQLLNGMGTWVRKIWHPDRPVPGDSEATGAV
jgi:hypothetical protein